MLTKDDISEIGAVIEANNKVLRVEFAEVVEQNITPQFEGVNTRLDKVERRLGDVEERLTIVEHKLDRALYHELDRHERWIRQLAANAGVELARE